MSFEQDLFDDSALDRESAERKRELETGQIERAAATRRVNVFVLAACGSVAIGVVAFLVGVGFGFNLLGYCFGTLVTVLLVAFARRSAVVAEMNLGVGSSRGIDSLMVVLIVMALLLAVAHSFFMARHGF